MIIFEGCRLNTLFNLILAADHRADTPDIGPFKYLVDIRPPHVKINQDHLFTGQGQHGSHVNRHKGFPFPADARRYGNADIALVDFQELEIGAQGSERLTDEIMTLFFNDQPGFLKPLLYKMEYFPGPAAGFSVPIPPGCLICY